MSSHRRYINTFLIFVLYLVGIAISLPFASQVHAKTFSSANTGVLHAWTQLIDANTMSIRAIVAGNGKCPRVESNGTKQRMSVRATPEAGNPGQFSNTVCEFNLRRDNLMRKVDGINVPGVPDEIKYVAIIGDTGCRVSKWVSQVQDCHNLHDWPMKTVADTVSAERADLVIHVGDYLYREAQCKNPQQCGDVWGYNWPSWNADWFLPSARLRQTKALLLSRGNHEACDRAWRGWSRYLAPGPYQQGAVCVDRAKPFVVEFKKFRTVMYDSSDISASSTAVPDFSNIPANKNNLPTWFVTHRPFWAAYNAEPYGDYSYAGDTVMRTAFENTSKEFQRLTTLLVSGHVHYAQSINHAKTDKISNWPLQLIIGHSGTELNLFGKPYNFNGSGMNAKDVSNIPGFGYAVVDLAGEEVVFKGIHGAPVTRTTFK